MVIEKLKALKLDEPIAVIGAGVTGKSCADLLEKAEIDYRIFDENSTVPDKCAEYADKVLLGKWQEDAFSDYGTILLSPGVDTRRDCFAKVEEKLLTDIELFARLTQKPIVGVTGSNGKSTVVTLIHEVTQKADKNYSLCGNIGLPVLQALLDSEAQNDGQNDVQNDGYIIELSSYHLERSPSLRLAIGVWLNVSPDHLDRYNDYEDYIRTKAKILSCSDKVVMNADDNNVMRFAQQSSNKILFSQQSELTDFYAKNGLIYHDEQVLFSLSDFSQIGSHHADNIMSAFAVARLLGIKNEIVCDVLRHFKPLPSRAVVVGEKNGVTYINDSKGTNIGATVAAINGIQQPIILIAGGQGKGQDFSELANTCRNKVKHVVVFGQDADLIMQAMGETVPNITCTKVDDLQEAVAFSASKGQSGDVVMLSPACASFDMFPSYLKRGEVFETIVRGLISE